MLEELKEIVCWANKELQRQRLVTMTSGNVSGRDFDGQLAVIKPSGVSFDDLEPEDMVVVDFEGKVVEGNKRPSVDTATHLYVYRHMPEVGSVIHTHSNYATSFAALGRGIPVCLTAMGDEFGCPVPCSGYAKIGGEEIGAEIVKTIGESPAVLIKNHGVFTVGRDARAALKAAVMVEDIAKTMHLAMLRGKPIEIPPEEVRRLYDVYHTNYGQKK
ncbi:MAG: L-ribulose-5-phosphate 4-epimerase [Phycisphaerae bacterium]|jgi:L-ribulose-5-phosphate 4-epimerase|nr:L-ribulose-5-phosphate 4-epimerase [Phycisphaerae bacterium]